MIWLQIVLGSTGAVLSAAVCVWVQLREQEERDQRRAEKLRMNRDWAKVLK